MPKFTVKKSILINAPLEKVYASVRDLRQWTKWSPWLIVEPECESTYTDDGKTCGWDGRIIGSGEMEITSEEANQSIDYQLRFLKPWKSISSANFSFSQKEGQVEAIWTMHGSVPFFMFFMKSMMSAFVGMDFERGLKMLKDYMETGSVPCDLEFIGQQKFSGFQYVGIATRCPFSAMNECMERDFKKLLSWLKESGSQPSAVPFSIYRKWNVVKEIAEYTLGFPLASVPSNVPDGFVVGEMPSCEVYSIKHTGPFRHLSNAWSSGMFRARAKVFRQCKKITPFETYETNPEDIPELETVTIVHFPLKEK